MIKTVVICAHDRPGYYAGGPNAWLLRLLPDLQNAGYSVIPLFIGQQPLEKCPTAGTLKRLGFTVQFLDEKRTIFLKNKVRWILNKVAKFKPDVFIPNLVVAGYYAARWVRNAGIPTIGVIHSNDAFHDGLLEVFLSGERKRTVDAFVGVSRYLEEKLYSRNIYNSRIDYIPYGVPIFPLGRTDLNETLRIAYVGRIVQNQKRILDVAKAFCHAASVIPDTEFTIMGSGPDIKGVVKIIETKAPEGRVKFKKAIPSTQVQKFMMHQDVLVLLSDYEGLPIALLEGMSSGMIPVCLSEESGVMELIKHGRNGLIVEDRKHSFFHAIKTLRDDFKFRMKLSQGARETIEKEYDAVIHHKRWAELLFKLSIESRPSKIRIPLILDIPPSISSFRGEDRQAPTIREKILEFAKSLINSTRQFVRPRSRLRAIIQLLTK